MDETGKILGDAFLEAIRQTVREEIVQALSENGYRNNKPVEMGTPYLTIREAAKVSRLGQSTIRLLIRKRQLKALKVGERVIIKRADLEQFIESHPIEISPD